MAFIQVRRWPVHAVVEAVQDESSSEEGAFETPGAGPEVGYDAWGNLTTLGVNNTTQSAYVGCLNERIAERRNQRRSICKAGRRICWKRSPVGIRGPILSDHGQTQKSLVGKERGALRAFSLGRTASQQASAEDRDGPLAMPVLFLVPHRR